MGRIANCWLALRNKLPSDYVRWDDLSEIRRQVLDWESTITTTLEKLNAYYARERKRQTRELERMANAMADLPPEPGATPSVASVADRKAELRRRVFGGALPAVAARRTRQSKGVGHVESDQGSEGQ